MITISDKTIPAQMLAYVLRPAHHGEPINAFKEERVDLPPLGANEVLIKVMAAGINYNGVWAALGSPYSPTFFHGKNFHIAGSDASGIVWKIGEALDKKTLHFKEGDHIVLHCGQYCGHCVQCNGGDPMLCPYQKIWGYETPYGSFAEFTVVKPYQILPKPKELSWAEAASYTLVLATAWRMLLGHYPHTLRSSQNVLIWGASGGIGTMAIQIVKNANANPIAVVSSEERGQFCLQIGAKSFINRNNFDCWGIMPNVGSSDYLTYMSKVKKFKKAIWDIIGTGNEIDIVIEHVGEKTFPVSCYIAKKGGLVVYCGATSGFNLSMDAAYGWMHQKRIQGSHFASTLEAFSANELVCQGKIKPYLGKVYKWQDLPLAHQLMKDNQQLSGCMAVEVSV
ncbi:MAG TPA: crotonyl-CoA carboxylase/reductase [Patescibacteria group bacterium]|nr:crotonyl-CoA carboxylase/reductase [Gammaproteobacteria bacterium]HWA51506.1 crotonyl-CoA carboxylase/reductase [Patescibacteria group bacterium]